MLTNFAAYLANARKAIINIGGLILVIGSFVTVPDQYAGEVAGVLAAITAIVHYLTSNAEAPGTGVANEELDPTAEDDDAGAEVPSEFLPAEVITAGQVAAQHQIDAPPPLDLNK